MIPAAFKYERAESLDHAIELLDSGREAKLLAGGHSLLPMMKLRFAQPDVLIDVARIPGLAGIREEAGTLIIGALTRHHDVSTSEAVRRSVPVLAHAAGLVGDPQVRHRGTIGGSIAHADPASDLATVLLTLEAHFVATGPEGTRLIPADSMFQGLFETALQPTEVLTEIRVGVLAADTKWRYVKFRRRSQDWATVGVCVVANFDSRGRFSRVAVGLTNMGLTPLRAGATESALAGGGVAVVGEASALAAEGTSPASDTSASSEFRRYLAGVLVRRALEDAFGAESSV